jgi:hypothetical protein
LRSEDAGHGVLHVGQEEEAIRFAV